MKRYCPNCDVWFDGFNLKCWLCGEKTKNILKADEVRKVDRNKIENQNDDKNSLQERMDVHGK